MLRLSDCFTGARTSRSHNAHGSSSVPQLLTLCKRQNSQVTAAEVKFKNKWSQLGPVCEDWLSAPFRLAKDEIEVSFFSCWIAGCPLSPSCYVKHLRLLGLMPGRLVSSVPTRPKNAQPMARTRSRRNRSRPANGDIINPCIVLEFESLSPLRAGVPAVPGFESKM